MPFRFSRDASSTRTLPGTLFHAAETGNVELLRTFVQLGLKDGRYASITLQQQEAIQGMMPLHVAAEHGQAEVVQYLISQLVDLDAGNLSRETALHLAAWNGHMDVADALLKARATVDARDVDGDMPIHYAAAKGRPEIIQLLARHKSPLEPSNSKGWTPMHRAAVNGQCSSIEALVKLGASVMPTANDGSTPLHIACANNYLAAIQLLLSYGAKMHATNFDKQTPYDLCVSEAAMELFQEWGYWRGLPRVADGKGQRQGPAATTSGLPRKSAPQHVDFPEDEGDSSSPTQHHHSASQHQHRQQHHHHRHDLTSEEAIRVLRVSLSEAAHPSDFLAEAAPHELLRVPAEAARGNALSAEGSASKPGQGEPRSTVSVPHLQLPTSFATLGAKPPLHAASPARGPSWSGPTGPAPSGKPASLSRTGSIGSGSADRFGGGGRPLTLARAGSMGSSDTGSGSIAFGRPAAPLGRASSGSIAALPKGRFSHIDALAAATIFEDGSAEPLAALRLPHSSKSFTYGRTRSEERTSAPHHSALPPLSGRSSNTSAQSTPNKASEQSAPAPAAAAPAPSSGSKVFGKLQKANLFTR